MLNANIGVGCNNNTSGCSGSGCPKIPDFCIKRNDTRPAFKISMTDCDGVVDLTDENLALEASMWFDAKLKTAIDSSDLIISFADNIGFDQVMIGDIILTGRARSPEKMVVTSIDEINKTIEIERAQYSTVAQDWAKGTSLKVFRFFNQPGQIESVFDDVTDVEGTTTNQLVETFLVFNWDAVDTSLPGCYWFEFKLMMMSGADVEWTKRMPLVDAWMINVIDSPTVD